MYVRADFHCHSHYSEGQRSPASLVRLAKASGIRALSLTDHNTIAGVAEAVAEGRRTGVRVVCGVEFYTSFQGHTLHLLGYGFDPLHRGLNRTLERLSEQRRADIARSCERLASQGFVVDWRRIVRPPSRYPGFVRVIAELERSRTNQRKLSRDFRPLEPSFFGIINRYFSPGTRAALPETSLPMARAIRLIRDAGGVAVLAHPGQQLSVADTPIIRALARSGIAGLEVFTPYHTWHQIEHYLSVAKRLKLAVTGGSDYHFDLVSPGTKVVRRQWDVYSVPATLMNVLLSTRYTPQ